MRYWLVVPIFLIAGSVMAQTTAAELSAKGAKKLSKQEAQAVISGSGMSFTTGSGFPIEITHDSGGSISGTVSAGRGGSAMVGGNWNVNDAGQYCEKVTTARGGFSGCYDIYQDGDAYFLVAEDGKVLSRKITR
jgi:hypothetical protein